MEPSETYRQLRSFLEQSTIIPEQIWEQCAPSWDFFEAKRRTLLSVPEERERYLYFVLEGIQRIYHLSDDGNKEATLIFTYAPSLGGIADSILGRHSSSFYYETLTNSRFLRIPSTVFYEQCQTHPIINEMAHQLAASALKGVLLRQAELQTKGAEAKFRALLKRSPHLINLIPHKYLASYLGIDPTTFSKLLGRIKI